MVDLAAVEANRKTAEIRFSNDHLVLRNLQKGFYTSFREMLADLTEAVRSSGEFFSHKERNDQCVCIFRNRHGELFGFPVKVEKVLDRFCFTIITLYRSNKGELKIYRDLKTLLKKI